MADNDSIFVEKGRASLLEQYLDITARDLEVISLAAWLQSGIVFGLSNTDLHKYLHELHFKFGGLQIATISGTAKHLSEDEKTKLDLFINSPLDEGFIAKGIHEAANRPILITQIRNAIDVCTFYQRAMEQAGYRKVSYQQLKKEYLGRENR